MLGSFAAVAVGMGAARAVTTGYVPVLLEEIADQPAWIGVAMLSNAAAGLVVPLVIGARLDRRPGRRTLIGWGAVLAAGGLVAIGLGNGSSYLALALAAAAVYVGLNIAQTTHRALVAERFDDSGRPSATGAQELAQLGGALVGTVAGGLLVLVSPGLLFGLVAALVIVSAVPTLRLPMVRRSTVVRPADQRPTLKALAMTVRRAGAREILAAQGLWVMAYVGLTPFFVLYATDVLGVGAGVGGALLAGFGLLTGAGMLIATRVDPAHVRSALALGAAALGTGLAAAAAGSTLTVVALPFALAALGAGAVSSLGFPYFSRFIPPDETGLYSGAFYSVRAIAATAAVPAAGAIVAATGSYRALLGFGVLALAAVPAILRAEGRRGRPAFVDRSRPVERIAAVIPVFRSDRFAEVALATARHVDHVILVDDGAPPRVADRLQALAGEHMMDLVRLGANRGKGAALAAGIEVAKTRGPDAILVLDSDGQHPPALIPEFVAAARTADLVIGDRTKDRRRMPALRRLANAVSSQALSVAARRRLRDSQNGMRLIRTEVLVRFPFPTGRYESESRHLKAMARGGARIERIAMPAIYDGEPSDFRPLGDTVRVARAIVAHPEPAAQLPGRGALVSYARIWSPRLAAVTLLGLLAGALLPLLQGVDGRLFLAINGLGDGPEVLYEALDPHSRNYALLAALVLVAGVALGRRWRHAVGGLLALVLAAFAADLILEVIQIAFDRPRPEEALGAQVDLTHSRSWAAIPSFPSGHLMVTAAMVGAAATAVPLLRRPLYVYLAAIAVTRIMFGAHFPLDVGVGALIGWEVGLFSAGLVAAAGLLPDPRTLRRSPVLPIPEPAMIERTNSP
jgi:membrane-associated phospholipid phosphatase/MFS family permease